MRSAVASVSENHREKLEKHLKGVSGPTESDDQLRGPRGTHPPRSTISTRRPASTSSQAAMVPPKPLPTTTAS